MFVPVPSRILGTMPRALHEATAFLFEFISSVEYQVIFETGKRIHRLEFTLKHKLQGS